MTNDAMEKKLVAKNPTKKELEIMRSWSDGGMTQNGKVLTLSFTPKKLKQILEAIERAAVEDTLKTIEEQLNLQYLDDSKNHLGYGPDEYNKGIDVCFRVIDDYKARLGGETEK